MENKKNSLWVIVLIVIIALALGVFSGWYLTKEFSNKKVQEVKQESDNSISFTQEEAVNLINFNENTENEESYGKMFLSSILYEHRTNGINDFTNISNDDKLFIAGILNKFYETKSYDILSNNLIKIFGNNLDLAKKEYTYGDVVLYKYDNSTNTYTSDEPVAFGLELTYLYNYKIKSFTKIENNYVLDMYGLYESNDMASNFYFNELGYELEDMDDEGNSIDVNNVLLQNEDKLLTFEYTFSIVNGSYKLNSFKKL